MMVCGLWLRWIDARFGAGPSVWRGHYGFLFALLPPLLLVGLIQFALHTPLAGVFGLLFAVAVLFHAWGPRDLDVDVSAVVDAGNPAARREAAARMARIDRRPRRSRSMSRRLAQRLRRWFGVMFWVLC